MQKLWLFITIFVFSWMFFARTSAAATYTVCAGGGCSSTTITGAKALASAEGDVIQVQSTYDMSGEVYPIQITTASTTILCDSGATIGQVGSAANNTFQLTTSSTVSGCGFSNIKLYTGSSDTVSGVLVLNNAFSNTATSTIDFNGTTRYSTFSGNTGLDSMSFGGRTTGVQILQNRFYGDIPSNASGLLLSASATSTSFVVTDNYFESRLSTLSGSNMKLIDIMAASVTFATNTVRYISTAPSAIVGSVYISTTGSNPRATISGNKIEGPNRLDSDPAIGLAIYPMSSMTQSATISMSNNTFRNRTGGGLPVSISDAGSSASISYTATIQKNIFYTGVATIKSAMEFNRGASNSISATIQDNAVYGSFVSNVQNQGSSDVGEGSSYMTVDPILQLSDVSTSNDLDVAPFSVYLNIDGVGGKIGASTTTRRTTLYIDDNGTIDYSTVDALVPTAVSTTLRSGDTLNLAAGTYSGFTLGSTSYATSSISIVGAGASTIIDARTNENALTISGVTSTAISDLLLRNASSTQMNYVSTRMNFTYLENSYADAVGPIHLGANETAFINTADLSSATIVANDGDSVTAATDMGSVDFHLLLMSMGGTRFTVLVPNSVFSSYVDADAAWSGFGLTINRFVTSTFSVSGGVYTYNAAAVAAAGLTLNGGLTTPAITGSTTGFAGLKLVSSGGATISNVTSTINGYGIWFGSGGGNRIYDSVLSSSSLYDIRQDASVTNTVDNVTFTRTSSTVSDAPVLVKFQVRGLVRDAATPSTVLAGSTVSIADASLVTTSLGATGVDGYTSYSRVPAYTITASSAATTNGGYNPYSVQSLANVGYDDYIATDTIQSRNQTLTVDLVASRTVPTAPTSPTVGSIGASSAVFGWTDASSDEDSFTVNYVTSSEGEVLGVNAGTTVSTAAGASSATITLMPNFLYRFRVAAVNGDGTSAYATSSIFRTLAATPGAPTLSAAGRTTATISIDANANATSTAYHLYNTTSGSYIDSATGGSTSEPSWAVTSTWGALTITGLTCNSSYSFVVLAKNGDDVRTSTSTAGTVTTSACETSGGGGGGGGGGVGGGASIPYVPVSTTPVIPVIVTPVLPPIVVADMPTPSVPSATPSSVPEVTFDGRIPEPVTIRTLLTDARTFGVTLKLEDQSRLANFVEAGTTRETRSLGSGERRALVRDALQTLGRSDISLADLERLARGEIPVARNLSREREQLPRVRSTFRTIYGRDPNFKNSEENLVWNTLMYRIRFSRDLTAEKEGIQEFRRLFGRTPQDPFQWAAVRALGYVR